MEWQKIATSPPLIPRHRERVLVYDPKSGIGLAYFVSGRGWCREDKPEMGIEPTHFAVLEIPKG